MLTSLRFHLRGIARHTKGVVKTLLGMNTISPEDLARSTAAWHQPPTPGHPRELCICPEPDARPEDHVEGCPWALRMCTACKGDGYCAHCGGDAIDPAAPPLPEDDNLIEVP